MNSTLQMVKFPEYTELRLVYCYGCGHDFEKGIIPGKESHFLAVAKCKRNCKAILEITDPNTGQRYNEDTEQYEEVY